MKFKLIVALVSPEVTDTVIDAARKKGATGEVIVPARGSGLRESKFLGISITAKTDVILFIVEEHIVPLIIDAFSNECHLQESGNGIAIVLDIDRVIGMDSQISEIKKKLREKNL